MEVLMNMKMTQNTHRVGVFRFLTIHQSKGMEFPIVFVDSLSSVPRKTYKELMTSIEEGTSIGLRMNHMTQMKFFDFWSLILYGIFQSSGFVDTYVR